jgi:hypothetical protein
MLLRDFEVYADGIVKSDMYLWRMYLLKRLHDLGMPMCIAQKSLSLITFADPDKNLTKLDKIAVALYNLYEAVIYDLGQDCYYSELKRIGHIQ